MTGEPLTADEVTFLGEDGQPIDVTFQIKKLQPMDAKQVFMRHMRPMLRGILSADSGGDKTGETPGWKMAVAAFTDMPQDHYDATMRALYGRIIYRTSSHPNPHRLLGDEENAFKDLEAAHILALDARAILVNFRASFSVAMSEFPALGRAFLPQEPST